MSMERLERAAAVLGDLVDDVVVVGGATLELFITVASQQRLERVVLPRLR